MVGVRVHHAIAKKNQTCLSLKPLVKQAATLTAPCMMRIHTEHCTWKWPKHCEQLYLNNFAARESIFVVYMNLYRKIFLIISFLSCLSRKAWSFLYCPLFTLARIAFSLRVYRLWPGSALRYPVRREGNKLNEIASHKKEKGITGKKHLYDLAVIAVKTYLKPGRNKVVFAVGVGDWSWHDTVTALLQHCLSIFFRHLLCGPRCGASAELKCSLRLYTLHRESKLIQVAHFFHSSYWFRVFFDPI